MTNSMVHFDWHQPTTLSEFWRLLEDLKTTQKSFHLLAGGTDQLPLYKQRLTAPDAVVSLARMNELQGVTIINGDQFRLGAMTRLADVVQSDLIQNQIPSLALAASKVASPQIRNQGTLGGNILVNNRCVFFNQSEHHRESHQPCFKAQGDVCHLVKSAKRGQLPLCQARFVSDTVPVLLVHDAHLNIISHQSERQIKLRDFYQHDGIDRHSLGIDELVTSIELILNPKRTVHYEKLTIRSTLDFPSVGVAVAIEPCNDTDQFLSVALTGVHNHPLFFQYRLSHFESAKVMVEKAASEATAQALLYQQDFYPRNYRKKMIAVLIRKGVAAIKGDAWI